MRSSILLAGAIVYKGLQMIAEALGYIKEPDQLFVFLTLLLLTLSSHR